MLPTMPPAIRCSKRNVRISNFEQPQPISGNPPPDRDMPDAHDLDMLVTRTIPRFVLSDQEAADRHDNSTLAQAAAWLRRSPRTIEVTELHVNYSPNRWTPGPH